MKILLVKQVQKRKEKQNEDGEGSGLENLQSYFTEPNNDREEQFKSDVKVLVMEITEVSNTVQVKLQLEKLKCFKRTSLGTWRVSDYKICLVAERK